jgi:hypothetical protein
MAGWPNAPDTLTVPVILHRDTRSLLKMTTMVYYLMTIRRIGERFLGGRAYSAGFRQIASVVTAAICVSAASSCATGSSPTAAVVVPGGQVMLVPQITAGWAGWCMAVATEGSGGCGTYPAMSGPVFSESWSAGKSVTTGAALTIGEVAATSVDGGRPVPTRRASAVAGALGLRSVIVEIHSKKLEAEDNKSYPHFTPLSAKGVVIQRSAKPDIPLGLNVPVRRWRQPEHAPLGICELRVEKWPGVSARWGGVVTVVRRSYSGLLGRPFLSCASTEYFREEQPVEAGILLDASHPGAEPPPLPAMKAVAGHPGIFEAQGERGEGQMLGRRVSHAWLVVEEGGSSLEQRLALLEHLHATVYL